MNMNFCRSYLDENASEPVCCKCGAKDATNEIKLSYYCEECHADYMAENGLDECYAEHVSRQLHSIFAPVKSDVEIHAEIFGGAQ